MLVLSRKTDERIRIGDDIVLTIVRIAGNRVTIGIDAPRDCKITRSELLEEVACSHDHEQTTTRVTSGKVTPLR